MSYSQSFPNAILITVFIADKVQQQYFNFIPTREICNSLGFAIPTTTKILQALNKAGIIETREGSGGGVRLAVPCNEVSVLNIFDAIENKKPAFSKNLNIMAHGKCPETAQAMIRNLFKETDIKMREQLSTLSIADLITEA